MIDETDLRRRWNSADAAQWAADYERAQGEQAARAGQWWRDAWRRVRWTTPEPWQSGQAASPHVADRSTARHAPGAQPTPVADAQTVQTLHATYARNQRMRRWQEWLTEHPRSFDRYGTPRVHSPSIPPEWFV